MCRRAMADIQRVIIPRAGYEFGMLCGRARLRVALRMNERRVKRKRTVSMAPSSARIHVANTEYHNGGDVPLIIISEDTVRGIVRMVYAIG
jgi:hypothetical protein